MSQPNPFTPAFGTAPAILAGRDALLQEMHDALEQGRGNPNLSSILIGARGTGKTVCLSYISEDAEENGWVAVSTSAIPGMLEDLYEQVLRKARGFIKTHEGVRLTSLGIGPVSAGWEHGDWRAGNWRTRMSDVIDNLGDRDVGLLMTIDEVDASLDEMIALASVYQHFVREGRKVALVMAGLPGNVSALLSNKSVSFLRRAQQHRLARISDADVADAMRRTIESAGKTIDERALSACIEAVDGFPYMLQLVGFRSWQAAQGDARISLAAARHGIAGARRDFESHVLASTYRELSPTDLLFVEAMLPDKRESRLADIARRMGVTSRYASSYRARLQSAGVIEELARGIVCFSLPGFADYVASRMPDE